MAHCFAFFTLFHLSLTFFRPEVPFKSQRSYGFLITKKLIFSFQTLDLKVHFSASLISFFRPKVPFNIFQQSKIGQKPQELF